MNYGLTKPRILFVDDDAEILRALARMLHKQRARWEMSFVLGAVAGLEEIERKTFDVVVSDMRMPDFDGLELLAHVRDLATIRMVLSGYHERRPVSHGATVVHQVIDKPCASEVLTSTIERACALRARFDNKPMQVLLGRIASSPPQAIDAAVAQIIEADAELSTRTLELARAAVPELEVLTSITSAIAQVGLDQVAMCALAAATSEHDAACADLGAGLIRDISDAIIAISARDHETTAGERRLDLAAYLLTRWGMGLNTIEQLTRPDDDASPVIRAERTLQSTCA